LENIIIVALKAIIVFDDKILIIQRSADDMVAASTWEFVGGKLEFGEELDTALKREIKEEVGLDVSIEELLYATTFKTHEHRQLVLLTYLCTAESAKVKLSTEHQNFLWANKSQMLEMLHEPIITDLDKNDIWRFI